MPRDRGFRDPRSLLKLKDNVNNFVYRLDYLNDRNAWTTKLSPQDAELALQRAAASHRRHHMGLNARYGVRPLSPNDGHTIAVKDNLVTTKLPSSAASNILRGYVAPEDSTVVRRLEEAGMVVLGKTNMDEFGMGSHSLNSAFGAVMNGTTNNAISAGGSSGGSAYAVAANLCHFAIGTDTGGSVRLPAAYMNLVGFKPSYGRISRYGVVAYANSLDTVGILTRNCLDAKLLFRILDDPDPKDPTCLTSESRSRIMEKKRERRVSFSSNPSSIHLVYGADPEKLVNYRNSKVDQRIKYKVKHAEGSRNPSHRVGIPTEYNIQEMQPQVRTAWIRTLSLIVSLGHTVVPVSLPSTKQALSAYYVLAPAEAASNLAKFDGVRYGAPRSSASGDEGGVLYSNHRGKLFGDEVKRRILLGSFSLSAGAMDNYFIQAQKVRRLVQEDFNLVFRLPHPLLDDSRPISNGVDFIVCPTAPTFPPSKPFLETATPLESYMNDVFTVPASLAGLPAVSIPATEHLNVRVNSPASAVGIQVIGQYGDDYQTLNFASLIHRNNKHELRHLVGKGVMTLS
jgi:aspartyl-tRNA(Asn)/glutamyl-tRNA(Gln) amidotransferase subunit A